MADEPNPTPPPDTQTDETWLQRMTGNMQGDKRVGPVGITVTGALLIALTITILYLFTKNWPVCNDLGTEADDTAATSPANRNTAPPAGNANANANAARPSTNANAGNANAGTNTNANTNANLNAGQQTGTTDNGGEGATEQTGTSPAGNESPTKPLVRSIEPTQGPVTGKTMVTIKGRNFGEDKKAVVVRFGEVKAAVTRVEDESITVSTRPHSEGVVDVSVERNGEVGDPLPSAYTYQCPSPSGSNLFWMIIMAGALGGTIHAMRSLFWYAGQRDLMWSWLPMYFLLPFIGASMAMLFGFLIVAGFFDPSSTGSSQALVMIALAGLVGMFSQQAALKLKVIAEAVFTKPEEGSDAKPQKALTPSGSEEAATSTTPTLKATSMDVNTGAIGGGDQVIITGEGFSDATKVTFGGVPAQVVPGTVTPTSITVTTPERAEEGEVDVVVTSGNQSQTVPGKFVYTTPNE